MASLPFLAASARAASRPPQLQVDVVSMVIGLIRRNLWKGNKEDQGNVLPVVEVAVCLCTLSTEVGQVASEEEVVRRSDGEGVAHEGSGIDNQSTGHRAGDTV